ncbi:MAG TPA: YceI family protein [Cyclobacteriaceae bacterium]|nr:YceI family protein [Cyclobacteriaceae bacterium]
MINKKIYFVLLLLITLTQARAQKFVSEKGLITFFSHATIEDIKADNNKASALFYPANTNIAFSVPVNEFHFAKSLMQEHFNDKYLETELYPNSTFQGKLTGYDPALDREQHVVAKGKLTMHGVTKDVEIPGMIEKLENKLVMKSTFIVKLQDYKIQIPQLLWQNIAEQVEVTINFTFKPQ